MQPKMISHMRIKPAFAQLKVVAIQLTEPTIEPAIIIPGQGVGPHK